MEGSENCVSEPRCIWKAKKIHGLLEKPERAQGVEKTTPRSRHLKKFAERKLVGLQELTLSSWLLLILRCLTAVVAEHLLSTFAC